MDKNYKKNNSNKAGLAGSINQATSENKTQSNEDVSKRTRDENLSNRNDKNSKYQD